MRLQRPRSSPTVSAKQLQQQQQQLESPHRSEQMLQLLYLYINSGICALLQQHSASCICLLHSLLLRATAFLSRCCISSFSFILHWRPPGAPQRLRKLLSTCPLCMLLLLLLQQ
jgi:hypothetical protein